MNRIIQAVAIFLFIAVGPGEMLNPGMVSSQDSILIAEEQRIDITIQNSTFLFSERVTPSLGVPTVIILRNQDIIRHGFTSPILKGLSVTAEGEGITAYGEGMEGFYVDANKTLVLRLTIKKPGRYVFTCDLHPDMKGELLVFEMART